MGSRALLMVKEVSSSLLPKNLFLSSFNCDRKFPQVLHRRKNNYVQRIFSTATTSGSSSLEPLDVPRLAETARISLTPQEVRTSFLFSLYLNCDDGPS